MDKFKIGPKKNDTSKDSKLVQKKNLKVTDK